MPANISKSDIISAVTVYLASNERPNCPVNYLIDEKFGKQNKKLVMKLVADLKEAGALIGKRGRTGGLCFPETTSVEADPVETSEAISDDNTESNDDVIVEDGMEIEEVPF